MKADRQVLAKPSDCLEKIGAFLAVQAACPEHVETIADRPPANRRQVNGLIMREQLGRVECEDLSDAVQFPLVVGDHSGQVLDALGDVESVVAYRLPLGLDVVAEHVGVQLRSLRQRVGVLDVHVVPEQRVEVVNDLRLLLEQQTEQQQLPLPFVEVGEPGGRSPENGRTAASGMPRENPSAPWRSPRRDPPTSRRRAPWRS